ncbi:MAG TPA: hypothetical protein VJJ27_01800 [Candidatus Paceibacterota bacterium]
MKLESSPTEGGPQMTIREERLRLLTENGVIDADIAGILAHVSELARKRWKKGWERKRLSTLAYPIIAREFSLLSGTVQAAFADEVADELLPSRNAGQESSAAHDEPRGTMRTVPERKRKNWVDRLRERGVDTY